MASGITIQKNYVSSSLTNYNVANNWTVLVFGVTSQGPTTPTLIQNYNTFTKTFGQPVYGVLTHPYVQFLLNSGVSVLFKRVIDTSPEKFTYASLIAMNGNEEGLYSFVAKEAYRGEIGNNIVVNFVVDDNNNVTFKIGLAETNSDGNLSGLQNVESYFLGNTKPSTTFINLIRSGFDSEYITATLNNTTAEELDFIHDDEFSLFTVYSQNGETNQTDNSKGYYYLGNPYSVELEGKTIEIFSATTGQTPENNYSSAINLLSNSDSSIWLDSKLKNAITYYPQLRFVTTGGLVAAETGVQDTINSNLGQFVVNCGTSFRALIDYPIDSATNSLNNVRTFTSRTTVPLSCYAYFGPWGADSNNNWLPGSAGFLSALGNSGYNVYSRRIAGATFNPAFSRTYDNIYIDALSDWQSDTLTQANPIVVIDAQDNLAVMGSSTLAAPATAVSSRNPAQALDIVLVGDYVAALLDNLALKEIEAALDRLSLNSLTNSMTSVLEGFVSSSAITRYDLSLDASQLSKLDVNCVLYFAVGLEEVSLTVTSIYDVNIQ